MMTPESIHRYMDTCDEVASASLLALQRESEICPAFADRLTLASITVGPERIHITIRRPNGREAHHSFDRMSQTLIVSE
jgi:hypothetical protein